ncbi:MAG: T9SS type A sorting domain-containing protein [Candidatus Zixiibacteriota bacterium]
MNVCGLMIGSGHNRPQIVPEPQEDMRSLRISYIPSFEFPPRSRNDYLYLAGMGVGAIKRHDTLFSDSQELYPLTFFSESSQLPGHPGYSKGAVADQQFILVLSDTTWRSIKYSQDYLDRRLHIPLGLEVRQTILGWASRFARRFVLIDYLITNRSTEVLNGVFAEFAVSPTIQNDVAQEFPQPELCGLVGVSPGIVEMTSDTLNIAWFAGNDGAPFNGVYSSESPTGVIGVRILRPSATKAFAFNWAASVWSNEGNSFSWGPRHRRDEMGYAGSVGWYYGDRGNYRQMSNGEIDYDQVWTATDKTAEGWSPPPSREWVANGIARGAGTGGTLSISLADPLLPGDSIPFTVAMIAGFDFHRKPDNFARNFDPDNPQPYLDNLDFTDLINNARWADWVFDNPGVDTDGDGYRGPYHLVNCKGEQCDTVFYRGDGVPDFRAPYIPPPPPAFTLTSRPGAITLRWEGAYSELAIDPLSGRRDCEGFRIYTGKFDRDDLYSMVASWDVEDYKRFAYKSDEGTWEQISFPATVEQWQETIGDNQFDPRDYTVPSFEQAYIDTVTDTVRNATGEIIRISREERFSYWEREDYNRSNEYFENDAWVQNPIQRIGTRDTVIGGDTLQYGVYEATIDHLNPSVPLYFAVTAFDYGNYQVGLEQLESSQANNSEYAHPIYSPDVVVDSALRVSVYPNPYKVIYDGGDGERTTYYLEGYEGRGIYKFEEQDRRIWFVNLPEKATIRIFSLDGDLIRTINHPDPFLTKYPSAVGWDLVSRNIQAVTSGIYIWRVDSELGTQTGKLVIIK